MKRDIFGLEYLEPIRPPRFGGLTESSCRSCYGYSDMTGFQLVNATDPVGLFPYVFPE